MADPTFGELGTQSFGSLSLTSSGSPGLGLSSLSLEDLAQASFSDLATMGYEGTATSSDPGSTSSEASLFKPIMTTSSALSGISVVNGQFIVVLDTGAVYVDANSTRVALGLPNMWGSANSGKYLNIQSDGTIGMEALPVYSGNVTDSFPQYNGEVE